MRTTLVLSVVAAGLMAPAAASSQAPADDFDPATVEAEILEHFAALNGPLTNVQLWDSYFFQSPRIGNIHDNKLADLGWEQWHKNNIEYFSVPRPGTVKFSNIKVYPIRRDLAWVAGEYAITAGGETRTSWFYDAMLRVDGRWSTFMSVVNPKHD